MIIFKQLLRVEDQIDFRNVLELWEPAFELCLKQLFNLLFLLFIFPHPFITDFFIYYAFTISVQNIRHNLFFIIIQITRVIYILFLESIKNLIISLLNQGSGAAYFLILFQTWPNADDEFLYASQCLSVIESEIA